MSFRRENLTRIGGFNELLGSKSGSSLAGEETELCLRLRKRYPEFRILYDPACIVHHTVPRSRQTIERLLERAYREGVSKAIISRLHTQNDAKLSTEKTYLNQLISRTIPQRLMTIKPEDKAQLAAILLTLCSVGIGYCKERI